MTLSAALTEEKNKLSSPFPWVVTVDFTSVLCPYVFKDGSCLYSGSETYCHKGFSRCLQLANQSHFGGTAHHYVCNTESIVFKSMTYSPLAFGVNFGANTTEGKIQTIALSLPNVDRVIQNLLESIDGGIDKDVVLRIVNTNYLTDDFSDLEYYLTVLGSEFDELTATLSLGLENPLDRRFPTYRFFSQHCNWIFKSLECGYSGGETTCNLTLDRCRALSNQLHFGGFPGLTVTNIRFA